MGKPVKQRKKWRIRWLDESGQRKSEVYEKRDDAKFALSRHEAHVEEKKRGLRELAPPKKTFDELCDYWLKNKAPQKRNQKDDESVIRAHLRPHFGGKLLSEIKGSDIDTFKISKRHLSNKTISNQLTLLITMLNLSVDEGWIKKYPKIKKPKVSIFNKDFNYLKTNTEIQRFLAAAHAESKLAFTLYATAIYSGMREGERGHRVCGKIRRWKGLARMDMLSKSRRKHLRQTSQCCFILWGQLHLLGWECLLC